MKKFTIDTGIEEFEINGGKILRFNPADINLYKRFIDAQEEMLAVEKKLVAKAEAAGDDMNGEAVILLLSEADAEMKDVLNRVFGEGNDFNNIFEGVNLMSVATNGERVVTNFVAAILPIIEKGAQKAARAQAQGAAAKIRGNRAARRVQK